MIKEYGYEYDALLDKELWNKTQGESTEKKLWGAYCLRSGRDALKVIAREYPGVTVLMPALACDSMIVPFELYGCSIKYYRLKDNLQADEAHITELINSSHNKIILLYSDYFGIEMIDANQLIVMKKKYIESLILVRDITHNLLVMKKQDIIADYTVASLRKWVNVPDGGLLWTKEILKNDFFLSDLTFSEKRLEAQCMRNEFFCTGDIELKNRYRSIFATISNLLDSDVNPVKMSAYAYQKVLQTDWDMIYEQRKLNATELINKLKNNTNLKLIQKESGISDLYVPFNINERESVQQRLAALGIFNTIIWPLRDEQKKCCTVTKYIEEHMLAAPCDQRYRKKDMEYIAKEIERVLNE